MKLVLSLIAVFVINNVIAQNPGFFRDSVATVIVHQDPRFEEMAARQAELNRKSFHSGPRRTGGFRIQAANTQNRDEANAVKAELLRRFPDQKTYLLYRAPNFRVRIGNFLTQKEAFPLRKMISSLYPAKGIYIVADTIEYTPPIEDDKFD